VLDRMADGGRRMADGGVMVDRFSGRSATRGRDGVVVDAAADCGWRRVDGESVALCLEPERGGLDGWRCGSTLS